MLKPLVKSVLISLTATASATDTATQKNIVESSITKLIISNEEMNYIIKMIKCI